MSLKNQLVYIQFHPVAYMIKLNIEMSMAALITKLARGSINPHPDEIVIQHSSEHRSNNLNITAKQPKSAVSYPLNIVQRNDQRNGAQDIHIKTDITVLTE